ncbi:MAG: hypothetical protein H5U08_01285 [Thermogutta sp.]|uniref:hypothetical protein n=1 Tax=Thermogutta sp. TaxID=1962930 RepID=UPI0019C99B09|nr:hypothetical protein [Thermogutta sp.]MBC7350963.1 hypothetical protein [Thermogutta sp.]
MANEYDPYREALVVEKIFLWPKELDHHPEELRRRVEHELDAHPQHAEQLAYVRLPVGFRREITITVNDIERILGTSDETSEAAQTPV